jgi:hypothetical protein
MDESASAMPQQCYTQDRDMRQTCLVVGAVCALNLNYPDLDSCMADKFRQLSRRRNARR